MTAILNISDGTLYISLLGGEDGFHLSSWRPNIAQHRSTWQQSPLSDGRRLVNYQWDHTIDTFSLKVQGVDQDQAIFITQQLRRLLEKAAQYWTADWQNEPVWLEAQATCETNLRYALIHSWSTPDDENPFAMPFLQPHAAVMDNWTLNIEHGFWTEEQPTVGTCVQVSGIEGGYGRSATCSNEVYVANKRNMARLDYVFESDGGFYTSLLGTYPHRILPAVPAVNDALYLCSDTSTPNSGPFCSLVFDLSVAQANVTGIAWEYWDGAAWSALTVQDNTNASGAMTGVAFDTTGVNSVHWHQPDDWDTRVINAITGYWVRARVTAIGGGPTGGTQQNRDIYTIIWNTVTVGAGQVPGDVPVLARIEVENVADYGPFSQLRLARMLVGLRSTSRGTFTSFINAADEQNLPAGITVTAGEVTTTFTDDPEAASGRKLVYNPAGIASYTDVGVFTIDTAIIDNYRGRYHTFVIAAQVGGADGDFSVRILGEYDVTSYVFHTGDPAQLTESHATDSDVVLELLDTGSLDIPRRGPLDDINICVQAENNGAPAGDLHVFALVMLPTDEWSGDFYILPDSFRTVTSDGPLCLNEVWDVNNITFPKLGTIASMVDNSGNIFLPTSIITNQEAQLQANAGQDIHFVFARNNVEAGSNNFWQARIAMSCRVQVERVARYLYARGNV